MTDRLFEVISKEEFESSGVGQSDGTDGVTTPVRLHGTVVPPPTPNSELTWCEFCKGYYIAEYHYGREEDEPSG